MTVIRIEMVPGRPPLWRAWPDGRPELAIKANSAVEVVGKVVYTHPQLLGVKVLHRLTPADHIRVR